ncbi:hypothetical protein BC833DRAFT_606161 [Globomyces pollinis-pini]|nr:hypothetical protein BC833DRAFT_606161 [Globomyces pollinis-pini]
MEEQNNNKKGKKSSSKSSSSNQNSINVELLQDLPNVPQQNTITTKRQLANRNFRFENILRDAVLDLSDALDNLDTSYKSTVLGDLKSQHESLALGLEQYVSPPQPSYPSDPLDLNSLNPDQVYMLSSIMGNLSISQNDYNAPYDFRLSYRELLNAVIRRQGNENYREAFLSQLLTLLPSPHSFPYGHVDKNATEQLKIVDSIRHDLQRRIIHLHSDEISKDRKRIIDHAVQSIQQTCSLWHEEVKKGNVTYSWPLAEYIRRPDSLLIHVHIGTDIPLHQIKLQTNPTGTQMIVKATGDKPFTKNLTLHTPVITDSINATVQNGVLQIKCDYADPPVV